MELSVLQLFIDVLQRGSFAAAAREHGLDPSSVSRAISGLEDELGVRLFQRTTRKLSPTEAGNDYFSRVEPLVREIGAVHEAMTDDAKNPRGTLRATASVSFGQKYIVPKLASFQQRYPELTVELHLTDTVVDLVTGRFDLAVRLGRPADSTLIAQKLMSTRYYVCGSPEYLASSSSICQPEQLVEHNCLLFPLAGFRSAWRFRNAEGRESTVPISGKTVISSALGLAECCKAGMGLALLAGWVVEEELRTGQLVDVFPEYTVAATDFETAAWLVYPSRAYVPLKVRAFMDFLRGEVASQC